MHSVGAVFADFGRDPRLRGAGAGRGAAYGNLRYVERAKEYVFENLYKPVKERETAQFLGISPEYFCAVFKNTEGIPFQKFVNRVKLEKIRSLMEKEKMPLCKAAELLG